MQKDNDEEIYKVQKSQKVIMKILEDLKSMISSNHEQNNVNMNMLNVNISGIQHQMQEVIGEIKKKHFEN
jgi:hypothetical protein